MTRFAARRRVYFLEEPVLGTGFPFLAAEQSGRVTVLTPQLPRGLEGDDADVLIRQQLRAYLREQSVVNPVHWFYTPMMLPIVDGMPAAAVAYDCMDELSAFAGAPPNLVAREKALLEQADVVFTGGHNLYEHKRNHHANVHAFPSSVDVPHFAQARTVQPDPEDQAGIPHPRIGYCGVIDERMDLTLIGEVARLRPDLQIVMIGPTAKVDPSQLPRAANIHYLGMKRYEDLPSYMAGWDVAMLPFARNDSTRFISPTKTPEYLAAGRPVVATSVRDVVRPYGELNLARIADTPEAFVAAIEQALLESRPSTAADAFLADLSWDRTWYGMNRLVDLAVRKHARPAPSRAASRRLRPADSFGTALAGEA